MRVLSVAFALLALPFFTVAQAPLRVAPIPTSWDVWGVAFTSATKGFACGSMHDFYKTADGGLNWTKVNLPGYQDQPLYNVTFVDQNLGFVSGNSAVGSCDIYRTTDGGETWQTVNSFPLGGSWYHQDYVSPTTGFMGCNGALVRTTDSGLTWPVRSAYPDCPVIYGMDFIDANTGLVGGTQVPTNLMGVFKTTDGGATWQLKHPRVANDVVYLTNQVAIADDGVTIARSIDGGNTWNPTGAFVFTGLDDIEALGATSAVGVSGAGDIWRTTDGGFTWARTWVGEGDLPANWTVQFRDALNGHVAGQGGLMYETHDGGLTWSRLNRGVARTWEGVAAFSDTSIVVAGHHGYVQTTTDAGAHWVPKLLDPPTFGRDTGFSAVSVTGSTAVAVGAWGSIFKSTDGGQSWQSMIGVLSLDYYANGVKFTDANNGWIAGWDYTVGPKKYVQRTRDGGYTWEAVEGANIPSLDIEIIGQKGWILTSSEPLWRTLDGGATWTMLTLPDNSGNSPSNQDMSWGSANVGYVCGWDGYVVKTTNSGTTWTQVLPTQFDFVYLGVCAVGEQEVWLCGGQRGGGGAVIKRSLDGGGTWQTWSLPGPYTSPYKMVRTKTHLYVVGYSGDIWRFDRLGPILGGPIRVQRP